MNIHLIKKSLYFNLCFFLLIFICCEKNKSPDQPEHLAFNVDSLLIGTTFVNKDLGITFNPPVNWEPVNTDVIKQLKSNSKNVISDSSNIELNPVQVFVNKELLCYCFLSTFNSQENPDEIRNKYISNFKGKYLSKDIKEAKFAYRKFKFNQIFLFNDNMVYLKLIIRNESTNIFMIDYAIPDRFYENQLKAIESSIGSLNTINHMEEVK